MNNPSKNYTTPSIRVVSYKVEQVFAAYPPNQEETEITWTEEEDNPTEGNHFEIESFTNSQTW